MSIDPLPQNSGTDGGIMRTDEFIEVLGETSCSNRSELWHFAHTIKNFKSMISLAIGLAKDVSGGAKITPEMLHCTSNIINADFCTIYEKQNESDDSLIVTNSFDWPPVGHVLKAAEGNDKDKINNNYTCILIIFVRKYIEMATSFLLSYPFNVENNNTSIYQVLKESVSVREKLFELIVHQVISNITRQANNQNRPSTT